MNCFPVQKSVIHSLNLVQEELCAMHCTEYMFEKVRSCCTVNIYLAISVWQDFCVKGEIVNESVCCWHMVVLEMNYRYIGFYFVLKSAIIHKHKS